MESAQENMKITGNIWERCKDYWTLIKSLQTGLLLFTGLAAYLSFPQESALNILPAMLGSMFLAVCGSTILNMVIDHDIDAIMDRTSCRPLPSGRVTKTESMALGGILSFTGIFWAASLSGIYGILIFTGLFIDVVVYSIWLKRRTPWSIIWGGISGGMPAMAGRALATGRVDLVGILIALAILLWIPTHIMTFSIKHAEDYEKACVPVFPNVYSVRKTRVIIVISTVLAVVVMALAAWQINVGAGWLLVIIILGVLLSVTAAFSLFKPKLNHYLFKGASLYMIGSMLVVMLGA